MKTLWSFDRFDFTLDSWLDMKRFAARRSLSPCLSINYQHNRNADITKNRVKVLPTFLNYPWYQVSLLPSNPVQNYPIWGPWEKTDLHIPKGHLRVYDIKAFFKNCTFCLGLWETALAQGALLHPDEFVWGRVMRRRRRRVLLGQGVLLSSTTGNEELTAYRHMANTQRLVAAHRNTQSHKQGSKRFIHARLILTV